MQPAGVKQLCDAIYHTTPATITLRDLELHLTLINEYLVKVAAPDPLPAGAQVLLFDLTGFKLGCVMGDSMNLFQVSPYLLQDLVCG